MSIQIIIEFILALSALIIIHEIGHFVVGRLFKVDVEEFGLGYPPRILTLFEAKGTKYSLNWLPFGGFVRFKGETDPDAPGSLASANPWARIMVLLAGPMMNILVAIVLYAIIISIIGMPDPTQVQISYVGENSPAEGAGLMVGDTILMVNDQEVNSSTTLHDTIYSNLGVPISVVYQRGEETTEVSLVPRTNPPEEGAIGIGLTNPTKPVNPLVALPAGAVATYEHAKALIGFTGMIVRGELSSEEGRLVGFKGMYDLYEDTQDSETTSGVPTIVAKLAFFTNITISLAILNLLPIPALDGGRILFTLPEAIFHRRIPPDYENLVNLVSFGLLLLLLIYINLQDFINPVSIP
jgi:regulator of sigma E protease